MVKAYPAIFHCEENGYWVEFPDLPGCLSEGDDAAQALAQASAALGGYLCSCMDRGVECPQPSRIQSLHADGEDFVSMVAADPLAFKQRTKAVKKTLSIPQWLNDEAEKRHINFSSVLQQALMAQIQ